MKRIAIALMMAATVSICQGGIVYDYVIDSYGPTPSLRDSETMLMIGDAGTGSLDLWDSSHARIEGTSPLKQGGGVWTITMGGSSHLEVFGGEIHDINIGTNATIFLAGGSIGEIHNYQYTWIMTGDPPIKTWNPHITMICDVDSVIYDTETDILSGEWLDGAIFNIHLATFEGYDPAIENIRFIPEPGTVLLLGLGGVMLWRRRRPRRGRCL